MSKEQRHNGGAAPESAPLLNTLDYELQVIADMVRFPHLLPEARKALGAQAFSDKDCAAAWKTLGGMFDLGETIDLVTFKTRVGGDLFRRVMGVMLRDPGSEVAAASHCLALKGESLRRRLMIFAYETLQAAGDHSRSVDDLLGLPDKLAEAVSSAGMGGTGAVMARDAINSLAEDIGKRASGESRAIPTGFAQLSQMLYGGFGAGQLIVVAARPSVGKTAVMLQMARAAAAAGRPTLVFSLEMTKEELAQRLILSAGTLSGWDVASGRLDWQEFENCAKPYARMPFYIDDSARSIDAITAEITLMKQKGLCDIAFIDYLGLIPTDPSSRANLSQLIGDLTRKLKNTAKACGLPIVLLSQLNRASVMENRPPVLRDLRDSGSIEQDADIVLMLEKTEIGEYPLRMWTRKIRNGKAEACINLMPNGTYTDFTEGPIETADRYPAATAAEGRGR